MIRPEPPSDQPDQETTESPSVSLENIRQNMGPKAMSNVTTTNTTVSSNTKETNATNGKETATNTVTNTVVTSPDATKPDPRNGLWISDTAGNPSMSATFAAIAFLITTAIYVLSIFESIGPLKIRAFDAAACGSYLIPSLGLYFGRRWTAEK